MIISIVIPVLNEVHTIRSCLSGLQAFRARGNEVILVDGGSTDETIVLAKPLIDQVVCCAPGRAGQMNAGASVANGDVLLFVHADTILPDDVDMLLRGIPFNDHTWGRFDVRLSGNFRPFRVIEFCMNLRSRLTGIATGDQAIFISRQCFVDTGGFPEIALMEDIAFSKILRKLSTPVCRHEKVITSSRRWEKYGLVRTIIGMWFLRAMYYFGCDPASLAKHYD